MGRDSKPGARLSRRMVTFRFVAGLGVAALLQTSACVRSPTTPDPESLTLAPGQSFISASGARTTFVRVLSDSRCPIDALCIHAGEAVVEFTLSSRGLDGRFELHLLDRSRSRAELRGATLELLTLLPAPVSTRSIDPAEYRATVALR